MPEARHALHVTWTGARHPTKAGVYERRLEATSVRPSGGNLFATTA